MELGRAGLIQWKRILGFQVKAKRERRPRWLRGKGGFRDGYHVIGSFPWCIVTLLSPMVKALCTTYWLFPGLSPIIHHLETSFQPDGLIHLTSVHMDLLPPLWFYSCLLLPGIPLFNTQLKSNSSMEIFLSCLSQMISYLSETTPYIPFINWSSLPLFCYFQVSFTSLQLLKFSLLMYFLYHINSLKARILSYYPHISQGINNT